MKNKNTIRWLLQSVTGLLCTGTGLAMCIDAGMVKMAGGSWFWYGTFALVIFQAGLCLMIDSIRFRLKSTG